MTREEAKKKLLATGNINSLSKVECDNILNMVYDDFEKSNCGNCKLWVRSEKSPTLMRCAGLNGCEITGDKFYCSNHEIKNAKS